MPIDWSLNKTPNIIGNALAAYDEGKKERRREKSQNALSRIMGGGAPTAVAPSTAPTNGIVATPEQQAETARLEAQFPNAPKYADDGWADLTPEDRNTAFQFQDRQRQQQAAQRKQQGEQVVMVGRLAKAVKEGRLDYNQALQIGQKQGIDVAGAPPTPDPKWLDEQIAVADLYAKDDGETISGMARELTERGYKFGSPEFREAMGVAIQGKYAPTYTDDEGNMRRGQLPSLPQMPGAPQAGPQPGAVEDGYRFKGGNPADPGAWEPVGQGGPAAAPQTPFGQAFADFQARP